jgi:hypothetical protein
VAQSKPGRLGRLFWITILGGVAEIVLSTLSAGGTIPVDIARAAMACIAAIVASHNVARGAEDGLTKLGTGSMPAPHAEAETDTEPARAPRPALR